MFDTLLTPFHNLVEAVSHGNDMAAGLVTMWLLTVIGIMLRRVPRLVFMRIRSKFIVKMTLDKSNGNAPGDPAVKNFKAFLKWFDTLPSSKYDRNRRSVFTSTGDVSFVPGLGFHWFLYGGRYYWFRYQELDSQGVEFQKERITIMTFGISLKAMEVLSQAFTVKPNSDYLTVYSPSHNGRDSWAVAGNIPIKNHPALIVNPNVQLDVFDRVGEFLAGEQWYRDRGLAYKLTLMLMGPPGTGKTSIAREIAIRYGLRFHDVNLSTMDNATFKRVISTMKSGVLLIDDFEENTALHRRTSETVESEEPMSPGSIARSRVSLSTFLSVLDGAIPLDNVIVVLCTNHPEKLDPAIYRPGRVDYNVVVKDLEAPQVLAYIKRMYGFDYTGAVQPTSVAILSAIFNRNKHSFENFCSEYQAHQNGELNLGKLEYTGRRLEAV